MSAPTVALYPELLNVIHSTNKFHANGWSYEVAEKYLFKINGQLLEAGFYIHYDNENMNRIIKRTLELPTSFGCPMKCVYCASSCIKDISQIIPETLCRITDFIMDKHREYENEEFLITLTGTGDAYYSLNLICKYLSNISVKYKTARFTISSCNWTSKMLGKIEDLSKNYRLRHIQSTFISLSKDTVIRLIPGLMYIDYDPLCFFNHVKKSSLTNWRINYLLLKNTNDDIYSFKQFLDLLHPIKEKVTVRIASLNETISSKNAGLEKAGLNRSKVFHKLLIDNGINAYIFHSSRNDNLNCGQLILERALSGIHNQPQHLPA